jgi:hypothetical protein
MTPLEDTDLKKKKVKRTLIVVAAIAIAFYISIYFYMSSL